MIVSEFKFTAKCCLSQKTYTDSKLMCYLTEEKVTINYRTITRCPGNSTSYMLLKTISLTTFCNQDVEVSRKVMITYTFIFNAGYVTHKGL